MHEQKDRSDLNFFGMSNSDPRFLGIKIGSIGFLVIVTGVGLFFLGFKSLGSVIVYIGVAIGIFGLVVDILLSIIRKIRQLMK
jgi:hypothetical protein